MTLRCGACVLAVALLLSACRGDADSPATHSIRDSAGIRITTVHVTAGELPEWSLARVPTLRIYGGTEPFFEDVTSAARLSDGDIVVLDRQADQLHIFGPGGVHVTTLGRSGEGPGEFGNIATVTVTASDSIFVFDRSHDRVTVFHPAAGYVRDLDVAADSAGAFPLDVWVLGADRFALHTEREDLSWLEDYDGQPFVAHFETVLSIYDGGGARVAGPAALGTGRYAQFAWGSGGLPLYPRAAIAGAAGRLLVGSGAEWEIAIFGADLQPEALLRWPGNREPIGDADVAEVREYIETTLAPLGPDRSREILDLSLSEEALPEARPAHGRIVAGRDGSVWVSRFEPYGEEELWYVFGADGAPLGRVHLPERSRLLVADTRSILYVRPDSLDVQSVYVAELSTEPVESR